MKCSACDHVFKQGDKVITTSIKGKTKTVCYVKTKPSCAAKIDKGRGQADAFPEDLWSTRTYNVHTFDCVGAMVIKVEAGWKDGKVIVVKLNLPGGASMDSVSAFMGDTVRVELQKETLSIIEKPKATGKTKAPEQPGDKPEKK